MPSSNAGAEHKGGRMTSEQFKRHGREMVDYICDYLDTIEKRRVLPDLAPGYLEKLLPHEPPQKGEQWKSIMEDVEKKIMPGITHWQHPRFHAYFPAGNSYPSILAGMLGDAIGCIGFSWAASPACTELERIMMDWVAKMLGLPEKFLGLNPESNGGGNIQGSASEAIFTVIMSARFQAIKKLKETHKDEDEAVLLSKLVAYCSTESHSCVEKGAMMAMVKLHKLEPDDPKTMSLRGETVAKAIKEDRAKGLVPFFISTTAGTTASTAFDRFDEIGPICQKEDVWFHIDGAYAGSAFVCPELRHFMKGFEYARSFNTNCNKWMLINFDCSLLWTDDRKGLTESYIVDPLYLQHPNSDIRFDLRHWGIPLSRRFRALKIWFVLRSYGVDGLQHYIREHIRLAKRFESLIKKDDRFEVPVEPYLALVCFRLKGENANALTEKLLTAINASGKLHMVPAKIKGKYIIRFCVCRETATEADMDYAYKVISDFTTDLYQIINMEREKVGKDRKTAVEDPKVTDVFLLDRKTNKTQRMPVTQIVRMVSDPDKYRPQVSKTSQAGGSKTGGKKETTLSKGGVDVTKKPPQ